MFLERRGRVGDHDGNSGGLKLHGFIRSAVGDDVKLAGGSCDRGTLG
jgi:hypothetical protein